MSCRAWSRAESELRLNWDNPSPQHVAALSLVLIQWEPLRSLVFDTGTPFCCQSSSSTQFIQRYVVYSILCITWTEFSKPFTFPVLSPTVSSPTFDSLPVSSSKRTDPSRRFFWLWKIQLLLCFQSPTWKQSSHRWRTRLTILGWFLDKRKCDAHQTT